MKLIKNINNNVALCLDSKGNEVIVTGKGVGFMKPTEEIPLSKIERTFYHVDGHYLDFISRIDSQILDIACEIVDYANFKHNNRYGNNLVFALADHIEFAVHRKNEGISVELPLYYEVKRCYPEEIQLGKVALDFILDELEIDLPEEEIVSIALHFINYHQNTMNHDSKSMIQSCTEIVEKEMRIKLDKTGFNYTRFVTHMYYLLERSDSVLLPSTENQQMFETLIEKYPKAYQCALRIQDKMNLRLNDEEILYLIIHINRLCAREDCYQ